MTPIARRAPAEGVRARDVVFGFIVGTIGGAASLVLLPSPPLFLVGMWFVPLVLAGFARLIEASSLIAARVLVSIAVTWYAFVSAETLLAALVWG